MEMSRRTFLKDMGLAGAGVAVGPGQVETKTVAVEPYPAKMVPNTFGELAFTRSLHEGDMLVLRTKKIWVRTGLNFYDQSTTPGSIVIAAFRARTPIKALEYTTYPGFQIDEVLVSASSKDEADQKRQFDELIGKQFTEYRKTVGNTGARLVAFNAIDVKQPSEATILQLARIRNHMVWFS